MIAQLEGLITFDDIGRAYFTGFKGNKIISIDAVNSREDLERAAFYAKSQDVELPDELFQDQDTIFEQMEKERNRIFMEGN